MGVGVERSLAVGMTVMESAICSWIGCLLTTMVCTSSKSGVVSAMRLGSSSGFFWSSSWSLWRHRDRGRRRLAAPSRRILGCDRV